MRRAIANRMIIGAVGALILGAPTVALADAGNGAPESTSTTASTAVSSSTSRPTVEAQTSTTATSAAGTEASTTTTVTSAPEVRTAAPQRQTTGGEASRPAKRKEGEGSKSGAAEAQHAKKRSGSALPPGEAANNGVAPLPFSLRTPISGLPSLFLEAFDVPPFLLPIYQAAGIAYGVPWQVLAAINEVETDYGRDLNLSSAGAEGWMQFLPVEWKAWGVDANGAGYMDPYNPADAIFAAARYLSAAGGAAHIRAAVFAYNHSQTYVESVMLRAQLLGGLPPEMLGAVTDLAEARFPVHAASRFDDGFTTGAGGRTLIGTTIYSEPDAPVIAVKDGTVVSIGESPGLGLHLSLRDANGDVFTYADLGEVASAYPVLAPRGGRRTSALPARKRSAPAPQDAATAGVQPHPALSMAATEAGFTFGVTEELNQTAAQPRPRPARAVSRRHAQTPPRSFVEGPERVYLRSLRPGATVIAGTVLGHLSSAADTHMLFQVRPSGERSPLIDPKPLLDSWVALEATGVYAAKGESPFLSVSPTAGQALFESKGELQQQVLRDRGVGLAACERGEIEAGRIDRRVLATIELLSVSGLRPAVSGLRCDVSESHHGLVGYAHGDAFDVTAINGVPIAGHANPGAVADLLERKLLDLQGTMKPAQIAGPVSYLDARDVVSLPSTRSLVHVAFAPASAERAAARIASAETPLIGSEWVALDERLAEISDPGVSAARSSASLSDAQGAKEGAG
jgi:murein DD-endopeptidase MepM/ murein hydrolase activator NlpD